MNKRWRQNLFLFGFGIIGLGLSVAFAVDSHERRKEQDRRFTEIMERAKPPAKDPMTPPAERQIVGWTIFSPDLIQVSESVTSGVRSNGYGWMGRFKTEKECQGVRANPGKRLLAKPEKWAQCVPIRK